jgi:hypothetical protein
MIGYAIHHVCSCGWAFFHERWVGRDADATERVAKAAATAALASFVDYRLTPTRLRPGFETQLTKPSLLAAYAAFAIGLAIASRKR